MWWVKMHLFDFDWENKMKKWTKQKFLWKNITGKLQLNEIALCKCIIKITQQPLTCTSPSLYLTIYS